MRPGKRNLRATSFRQTRVEEKRQQGKRTVRATTSRGSQGVHAEKKWRQGKRTLRTTTSHASQEIRVRNKEGSSAHGSRQQADGLVAGIR